MIDNQLFDTETLQVTYFFPHAEYNERVNVLSEEIKNDIKNGKITVPGSVVVSTEPLAVTKWIRNAAIDKAEVEYKHVREKSRLAEIQRNEYYEKQMDDLLRDFPSVLADFIRTQAWDKGHAYGYREVISNAQEMAYSIQKFANGLKTIHYHAAQNYGGDSEISKLIVNTFTGGKDRAAFI